MFYCSSSFFFSTRDLRGPWADFCKILPRGQKHVQFTNAGLKNLGPASKKIWAQKACHIWLYFGPLPTLSANISGMDRDIQNWKTI